MQLLKNGAIAALAAFGENYVGLMQAGRAAHKVGALGLTSVVLFLGLLCVMVGFLASQQNRRKDPEIEPLLAARRLPRRRPEVPSLRTGASAMNMSRADMSAFPPPVTSPHKPRRPATAAAVVAYPRAQDGSGAAAAYVAAVGSSEQRVAPPSFSGNLSEDSNEDVVHFHVRSIPAPWDPKTGPPVGTL
eukprot:TRINITY_DN55557_c0_g1_i1.p1 TRINITY_DN55557_c0_g1~~TRINITY_DN55557_c0_g1_i1.p1  ORF type:complete len:189 (+),score=31.64 TRINITY_DN55557_c0_g1_i1:210-776(+)